MNVDTGEIRMLDPNELARGNEVPLTREEELHLSKVPAHQRVRALKNLRAAQSFNGAFGPGLLLQCVAAPGSGKLRESAVRFLARRSIGEDLRDRIDADPRRCF